MVHNPQKEGRRFPGRKRGIRGGPLRYKRNQLPSVDDESEMVRVLVHALGVAPAQ